MEALTIKQENRPSPNLDLFLQLIGANEKFILQRNKNGQHFTAWFSPELANRYDRISVGATHSNTTYSVDTAIYSYIIAVIDADVKPIDKLLEFLQNHDLQPTLIIETNKGFHFAYLSKEVIEIREIKLLDFYLKKLTTKKNLLPQPIDKWFNINFIRLPKEDKEFIFTEKFYTPDEFMAKTNKIFNILQETANLSSIEELMSQNKTYKPKPNFTLDQLLIAQKKCPALQYLDENPEILTNPQWVIHSRHYANLILAGDETAETKFLELSSRYPDYNEKENIQLLESHLRKGFELISCNIVYQNLPDVCEACSAFKRYETAKYSPYYHFTPLKINNPKYETDENFIYKKKDGGELKPIAKSFIIKQILKYMSKNELKIKVEIEVGGETFIIEHNADNKPTGLFQAISLLDPSQKTQRDILSIYFENFLETEKEGRVITFREPYHPIRDGYLNFALIENLITSELPSVYYQEKGDFNKWKEAYRNIIREDLPVAFLTGFSLASLYFAEDSKRFYIQNLNPVCLISSVRGVGKTTRLEVINSLYTNPIKTYTLIDDFSLSVPYLDRQQSKIAIPICIDELKADKDNAVAKLEELIYYIANGTGRNNTQHQTLNPYRSGAILSGEIANIYFTKNMSGVLRRLIRVVLSDAYKVEGNKGFFKNLQILKENYGFFYRFFGEFVFNERNFRAVEHELTKAYPYIEKSILSHIVASVHMGNAFLRWLGIEKELSIAELDFLDLDFNSKVSTAEDLDGSHPIFIGISTYLNLCKVLKEKDVVQLDKRKDIEPVLKSIGEYRGLFNFLFGRRTLKGTSLKYIYRTDNPLVLYALGQKGKEQYLILNDVERFISHQIEAFQKAPDGRKPPIEKPDDFKPYFDVLALFLYEYQTDLLETKRINEVLENLKMKAKLEANPVEAIEI